MEINSKHLKGMSNVTNFLSQSVYVKFQSIQLDLQSLRSYYSLYLMKLYKKEMQNTASSYRPDEVWEYLIDNYELKELEGLKSFSKNKYLLTDVKVIQYANMRAKNTNLKTDLDLIQKVLDYKQNIESIELLLSTIKENTRPRNISPAGSVKDGHISYRPKYDISKLGVLKAGNRRKILSESIHEVYYKHLNKLFSTIIPKEQYNTWTFLENQTRNIDSFYLQGILENNIRATTTLGKKVQDAYILMQRHRGRDFLFEESLEDRLKYLDTIYADLSKDDIYTVLGIDDYQLYYAKSEIKPEQPDAITTKKAKVKRVKYEVSILTGYYVYDYDKQEVLPDINRLLGITGEFSRENRTDAKYPTLLYNNEGELVEMYRVEDTYDLADDDIVVPKQKHKSVLPIVNTLFASDDLSTRISELEHIETHKFASQASYYFQYIQKYYDELN